MFSSRVISSHPGEFSMASRVWLAVFVMCEMTTAAVVLMNTRPQPSSGQVTEDIVLLVGNVSRYVGLSTLCARRVKLEFPESSGKASDISVCVL